MERQNKRALALVREVRGTPIDAGDGTGAEQGLVSASAQACLPTVTAWRAFSYQCYRISVQLTASRQYVFSPLQSLLPVLAIPGAYEFSDGQGPGTAPLREGSPARSLPIRVNSKWQAIHQGVLEVSVLRHSPQLNSDLSAAQA